MHAVLEYELHKNRNKGDEHTNYKNNHVNFYGLWVISSFIR